MIANKTIGALLIGFSIILLFTLVFVKRDIDETDAFLCEKFHENQWNMEECPTHKSNTSWLIVSAFGVGFLMLGLGIYMVFLPRNVQSLKKEFKDIDISKLDNEEKKIYEFIKSKGGGSYQADVIRETGFGKVKVTRILDRLETKDVLEKKRRGMTNIIVLK